MLVRQRPQRLRGDGERVGQDRQLAAPGRDDLAGHADVVAEVDVLLPGRERLLAGPVQGDHHLELAAAIPDAWRSTACRRCGTARRGRSTPTHLAGRRVGRQLAELAAHFARSCACAGNRPGTGRCRPRASGRSSPAAPASARARRPQRQPRASRSSVICLRLPVRPSAGHRSIRASPVPLAVRHAVGAGQRRRSAACRSAVLRS